MPVPDITEDSLQSNVSDPPQNVKLSQKSETELSNVELEHRTLVTKLREDLLAKEEKVKHLEKQEILRQVDKSKT